MPREGTRMDDDKTALWRLCASCNTCITDPKLDERISRTLASPPIVAHRVLLDRLGRHIEPKPILFKRLADPWLRLLFSVEGPADDLRQGTIVALSALYDTEREQTIEVHPVYAGADADSLLAVVSGSSAFPRPQEGRNGELAVLRFLEHKRALWDQFQQELRTLNRASATSRWRNRFRWALQRLYFCDRCAACRWGSPSFDGFPAEPFRSEREAPEPSPIVSSAREMIDIILASDTWAAEVEAVRCSGSAVVERPRVHRRLDQRYVVVVFPTDTEFLSAGSVIGLAAYFDQFTKRARYVHPLHAGPDPEVVFVVGGRELGLPAIPPGPACEQVAKSYEAWRRAAWSRFWLDELELGIHEASGKWLDAYWDALESMLSGVCVPVSMGSSLPIS